MKKGSWEAVFGHLGTALVERDTKQFPSGFTQEDRILYAQTYVLNLLGDLVEEIPQIREYLELRAQIVRGDVVGTEAWRPQ